MHGPCCRLQGLGWAVGLVWDLAWGLAWDLAWGLAWDLAWGLVWEAWVAPVEQALAVQ
jgi:hypothetical protein